VPLSDNSSAPTTVDAFRRVRGQRVLLDTNVIMRVEDARSSQVRGALLSFAEHNEVCICDTVMYELLRNLNAKRFRERHELLRRAGLKCLAEDVAVRAMFERLNWLYLSALRIEPWNFLHRQQNDLWIIAAGLAAPPRAGNACIFPTPINLDTCARLWYAKAPMKGIESMIAVELIPDPQEGGFTARVPDIPAYGEGQTEDEAILDLKEAIRGYIETFGLADALARLSTPSALRQLDWDLADLVRE
jgi:predicted RNase H-like HicB family nuclease